MYVVLIEMIHRFDIECQDTAHVWIIFELQPVSYAYQCNFNIGMSVRVEHGGWCDLGYIGVQEKGQNTQNPNVG